MGVERAGEIIEMWAGRQAEAGGDEDFELRINVVNPVLTSGQKEMEAQIEKQEEHFQGGVELQGDRDKGSLLQKEICCVEKLP